MRVNYHKGKFHGMIPRIGPSGKYETYCRLLFPITSRIACDGPVDSHPPIMLIGVVRFTPSFAAAPSEPPTIQSTA
jgi:hypothetical protein